MIRTLFTFLDHGVHGQHPVVDMLFATLDTRSRRLRFPEDREVVITDTVGFIRDLPKDLFAAFRATFEETADADLILHVIDAVDPDRQQHIATTERLLVQLGLTDIPRITVFNKCDLLDGTSVERLLATTDDAVAMSALKRETATGLLQLIATKLADRWRQASPIDSLSVDGLPVDELGQADG